MRLRQHSFFGAMNHWGQTKSKKTPSPMIWSEKSRYIAVRTRLLTITMIMAFPTLFLAVFRSFFPRLMLTKAQQPSPTITAIARATTVRGNTTVFLLFTLTNSKKIHWTFFHMYGNKKVACAQLELRTCHSLYVQYIIFYDAFQRTF